MTDNQHKKRRSRWGRSAATKWIKPSLCAWRLSNSIPCIRRPSEPAKKYKAHDEENAARIGDVVKIMETRPLSKDKRWTLIEIIHRAETLQ